MTEKLDLKPGKLKRPMDRMAMSNDSAMLKALCADLNNPAITGAVAPKEEIEVVNPPAAPPAPAPAPTPEAVAAPAPMQVAFTGRMKAGKDYLAERINGRVFGFADPLYRLLTFFFGTTNKDAFGGRQFMQRVGQWGRGDLTEETPVSVERASFCEMIRRLGETADFLNDPVLSAVDWKRFGHDNRIWLDALLKRVNAFRAVEPGRRVVVTNVRFPNERDALRAAGWQIWHVMAAPSTIRQRLEKAGLDEDKVAFTESEALARGLDRSVTQLISGRQGGPKLRCVWNDPTVPRPGHHASRLYTTDEFLARFTA